MSFQFFPLFIITKVNGSVFDLTTNLIRAVDIVGSFGVAPRISKLVSSRIGLALFRFRVGFFQFKLAKCYSKLVSNGLEGPEQTGFE